MILRTGDEGEKGLKVDQGAVLTGYERCAGVVDAHCFWYGSMGVVVAAWSSLRVLRGVG